MASFAGMLFSTAMEAGPRPPSEHLPRLQLYWHDPHGLLSMGFVSMASEVQHFFHSMGVELIVGQKRQERGAKHDCLVFDVILMPDRAKVLGLQKDAMGAVVGSHVSGKVIYVFFPKVMQTLGHKKNEDWYHLSLRTRELAIALARIVSHEVIHAIDPNHPHHEDGLMNIRLDRNALVARPLALDAKCKKVFLNALSHY